MDAVEVSTPILNNAVLAHPTTVLFETHSQSESKQDTLYLQPSPELAMRSLISQGSGAIYQICKAFRDEPSDATHSPEFSILEWYAPGLGYREMATEVCHFLKDLYDLDVESITCAQLFKDAFSVELHELSDLELRLLHEKTFGSCNLGDGEVLPSQHFDDLLDSTIERRAAQKVLCILDYPIVDPCFAKQSDDGTVMRFEIYVDGIEIANGYQEIEKASDFLLRFEAENDQRERLKVNRLPKPKLRDIPVCSGVAIGVDRLIARALKHTSIHASN